MKLQRLKLTQVNNVELRQEEMKHLIGASACGVIILIGIVISDWRIKHLRIH